MTGELKYYRHVYPEDDSVSFAIKKMEDIHDKVQGQPDEPHRHGYYTILWVKQARGLHRIDFHDFLLEKGQVYFIEPGQVHQIIEEEKSYGYALTFSTQFLIQNGISEDLIKDLFIRETYGFSPPLKPGTEQWTEMERRVIEMYDIMSRNMKYKYESVGALLKLFLIQSNNACTLNDNQHTQDLQSSLGLIRLFKNALELNFQSWHKVSQYANHLHISPDYLNTVLKSSTGKGAKEHIQDRIIMEARRLFLFADMSIKEVGYHLGFNEPAHFSSFFKKCMGISPSSYLAS